ncbi:MAG: hypothetical protein AMJ65_11805 [Phycisphaerae bacterium SG8_4]|nr:MAG: hypothetical protein AMJ65_11805 [Phycisphaerae bacterium SG8_4]
MSGKMLRILALAMLMSLIGDAGAAVVPWNGSADPFWSTPGNWDGSTAPTSADTASIGMVPGPVVATEGAVADIIWIGAGRAAADLTVDGGTLTTTKWVIVGINTGSNGTVNMKSGTFTINSTLLLGDREEGTGHVNLDGGVLTVNNLEMRRGADTVGTIDVQAGTLIVNGNAVSTIQGYIDNGWITAYNGNGTLELDYNVTNEGKTTLTAVHKLNPSPPDGGVASSGDTQLSWTLPDPRVPGQAVLVDVYFTDDYDALWTFVDPQAIQVTGKQNVNSVVVQTQPKTAYYWAVDTYIGDPNDPIIGPIFSFVADNRAPEVNAGADVVSWLQDGVRTRNLNGSVTDDGAIQLYTVQWTLVSEPDDPDSPDAVIADSTAENASVTMSAVGRYVLQLDAFDGEYTGSDTVTISVYADSCEATKALPDYQPVVGDLNGDCKVDDLDLALLEENWLKDISLTEEVELD